MLVFELEVGEKVLVFLVFLLLMNEVNKNSLLRVEFSVGKMVTETIFKEIGMVARS